MVTHTSPSPILSCVEEGPKRTHISLIPAADGSDNHSSSSRLTASTDDVLLQDVHISARLMEDFLELARENTEKDLETCGVLGAFLESGTYYVTTLIIPKQESTSNSCEAVREEEFFAIQRERSLFPVGWIHTHPSQSCFMSSVDLHTQYSYQVMVPEAFAIVMAPTDTSRRYGVFRLSNPGGMGVLRECQEKGFHSHREPADGGPIYVHCSNLLVRGNMTTQDVFCSFATVDMHDTEHIRDTSELLITGDQGIGLPFPYNNMTSDLEQDSVLFYWV